MQVELIAYTQLAESALSFDIDDDTFTLLETMEVEGDSEPDDLITFAGRTCYQSYNKPNEKTRSNADYIANIIRQKHESVLEHASATFYVEGVSRNMLLELERHRHLSFSVISQRFVNSEYTDFIVPPALQNMPLDGLVESGTFDVVQKARIAYAQLVQSLQDSGLNRKQSREAARAVLPGGFETKFVVTGNLRAWRDVLRRRYSVHADAEILDFADRVLYVLRDKVSANAFADFPKEPFND